MKPTFHQTPEEKLALNTQSTVSAIQENTRKVEENTRAIKDLQSISSDRSELLTGFTGVIRKLNENKDKVDQVKSAALISNQELKKIAKKDKIKVEIEGAEVLTIKGKDGAKGEKGDKGDKGDRGEKGDSIQGERGVQGEKGERGQGERGEKGDVGPQGIQGERGEQGIQGAPDSSDELVEKINSATKKIEPSKVKGLPNALKFIKEYGSNPVGGYASGGANQLVFKANGARISDYVTEINFSTGVTTSYSAGVITVVATGTSTSGEVPSGTIGGGNKIFTFTSTPRAIVVDQGRTMIENYGYTLSGLVATLDVEPTFSIYSI